MPFPFLTLATLGGVAAVEGGLVAGVYSWFSSALSPPSDTALSLAGDSTAFQPPSFFQLPETGLSKVGVWLPGLLFRTKESGYRRGRGFTSDSLNPK